MRRRIRWFLLGTVVLVGVCAGAYVARNRHLQARTVSDRDEGLRLLEQGDHFGAMHKIGPYVRRHPDDVETLFAYARARLAVPEPDSKHLSDGITLLRRVRGLDPSHAGAVNELLTLYERVGWVTELQVLAEELLARDPAHTAALHARATALAQGRQYEEALKSALRYNELRPQDVEGHVLTLKILSRTEDSRERLLAHADQLGASSATDPRLLIVRSLARHFAGDVPGATKLAEQAAAADLPDAPAALLLARQCTMLQLFDLSRAVLVKASERLDDAMLDEVLALRLWRDGRHAEVAAKFPLNGEKQSVGVRAARAMSLYELDRPDADQALEALREAGSRDEMARAWAVVIENRYARKTPDDKAVIIACKSALRHQLGVPQDSATAAFFHCALGEVYARVGEMDAAVKEWKDAAGSASGWGAPLVKLANVSLASGRFEEARALAEAAEQRGGDREALLVQAAARIATLHPDKPTEVDELLAFLDAAQQRVPDEQRLIPLRTQALSRAGRVSDAKQVITTSLAATEPLKAETLLALAGVSVRAKLGLEDECFSACEIAHGVSADLALARAVTLAEAGRAAEGLASLEAAAAHAPAGDVSWGVARARYLDRLDDPRAADAWRAIADAHPKDARVQWLSISAKAMQSDRAYIGTVLDRLKNLLGEEGLNWRIARARWLMDKAAPKEGTVQAALLLSEVTRDAPEVLAPRLLLADCLERLENYRGAIDQLVAAVNIQPDAPGIALKLGWLLHEQGETARSRVYLDQVLASASASAQQRRHAAELVAAQGDPQHALAAIEHQLIAGGTDGGADLTLATLYRQTNQPEKVEAACAKLLQKPDAAAIAFVADFYASQDRRADADAALARLDALPVEPGRAAFARARFYVEHGPVEKVVPEFEAAIAALPREPSPRQQLIAHLLRIGRAADAARALDAAAKAVPDHAGLRAVQKHAKHFDFADGSPVVAALLAWCVERPADEESVGEALETLSRMDGAAADPSRALIEFRAIADRFPRLLPLQVALAKRYMEAGKAGEAAAIGARLLVNAPSAPGPARIAAQTAAIAGRWQDALRAARAWRERDPSETREADEVIAEAYLQLGNAVEAGRQLEPYLQQARADRKEFGTILLQYARVLLAKGDSQAAAELLRPALKEAGTWRVQWIRLAAVAVRDAADAANWLREVEMFSEGGSGAEHLALAEGWTALAQRSKDSSHQQTARTMTRRAVESISNGGDASAEAHLALGVLLEMQGDADASETAYRAALRLDPNQRIAQNNLAMLLARQDKDLAEALALATRATNGDHPLIASFRDTLQFVRSRMKSESSANSAAPTSSSRIAGDVGPQT